MRKLGSQQAARPKIKYKPADHNYRNPYTLEEKAELLNEYNRLRKSYGVSACAFILQISEATIYRWRREAEEEEKRPVQKPDTLEKTNTAIATLCSSMRDKWVRLEAVFRFAVWLRWPCSNQYHDVAVAACLASYLRQTTTADLVSDLAEEAKTLLTDNLHLQTLARLCSDELLWDTPRWKPFDKYIDPIPNDERDLLAEIVWSIIAIGKNKTNNRLSGSLSKAFYLVKHGLVRSSIVAPGMIHKWWRENAPAAPFLYVERFHSELDRRFDPCSEDFPLQVDEIVSKPDALLTFFRNSKSVSETLGDIMSLRSSQSLRMPKFPDELEAEPISPRGLSREIVEALKTYRS